MHESLATLFSCAVALTTITISWPQVWVSCVRRRTAGLSPMTTLLGPALNVTWLSYGLLIDDPLQVVVNALMGVGNLAVLAALLWSHRAAISSRALIAPGVLVAGVATAWILVTAGVAAAPAAGAVVGAAGAVFGAISVIPQPMELLRRPDQDISGVSVGRYALAAVSGALWLTHGTIGGDVAVIGSATLGMTSAMVVLACVAASRRGISLARPRFVLAA